MIDGSNYGKPYPPPGGAAEMLNPDMELEADLGIDSIKRVEILAAFRAAAPDLPDVDPRDLAALRTLRAILDRLGTTAAPIPASTLPRLGPVLTAAGPGGKTALAPGMTVTIAGNGAGLAGPLTAALTKAGLTVLPPARIAEAASVIALQGLDPAPNRDAVARLHLEVFTAARAFAAYASTRGGAFVTVQDTGGSFALHGDGGAPWGAGLAGIAKTAATEWPRATARAIDIDRAGQTSHALAEWLVAELLLPGPLEVGLPADGRRMTLEEAPLGAPAASGPGLPHRAVLVVSGGARGVVAAYLLGLVPHIQPRLLLLGRTRLQPELPGVAHATTPAELTRSLFEIAGREGRRLTPRHLSIEAEAIIAAREVRATVAALEAAGAEVRYRSVDMGDAIALQDALNDTRAAWGGIDGVVHGAWVLADKLIAEQTDEQFLRVFRTKVDGLHALLAATGADKLARLCLFSSVAGRYGNAGQVAYAAANEVLNKVARAEAARRGAECRVLSLNWGPWDGGMVTDGLREAFARRGVPLIATGDGVQAFVAEMLGVAGPASTPPVEVVLGGRLDRAAQGLAGAALVA